jgi:ketosteroid isomerase-like protein
MRRGAYQAMTYAELVLASYDAYARGDIERAVAPLDPDVDWVEPETFPDGGRHRGRDAVARYLRQSRERWAELTVEPVAHQRGQEVIVVVRHHGTLLDGSGADITVADVFTLHDGRVVRMQAFADPAEAFEAFPDGSEG